MYKLTIFDLDGTLLDALDDIAVSANYALRQLGFKEHCVERYKDFIGHGPVYLITNASPPEYRDDKTVQKLFKIFTDYYTRHAMDFTKPYPGVVEALETLRKSGIKIAVYSNKIHHNVVRLCDIFFPGLIDMSVGFKDGIKPKPDPAGGFAIMERFGVLGEETAYIGDSGVDMITGNALGAYTIGVSWGFRPKSELISNGASVVIDNAEELVKIVIDK